MGHADDDLLGAAAPGEGDQLVDHRHDRVEALDREHLLAEVRLLDEPLEAVDGGQALPKPLLLVCGQRRAVGAGLDHVAQPHPLLVRGEVLDLVGDRAAVGLAHPRQRLQQRLALDPDPKDVGGDARHQLRREVEVLGLQRRVALRLLAEGVDVRGQVPVRPVRLEQGGRGLHPLEQLLVRLCRRCARRRRGRARRKRGSGCRGGVGVGDHGGGDAQVLGHRLVEVVLALQQLVDPAQERAGLRPLDHPVVVGGRHRHHLRDAERLDLLGRGMCPLNRVGDRAGGDDRALSRHQPRHGRDGPEPAGVGEGDVRALEVVGGELVLARLGDQVLVVGMEAGEVEAARALDRRHHQRALALALDVHGDPEAHPPGLDDERLSISLDEGAPHHRELLARPSRWPRRPDA